MKTNCKEFAKNVFIPQFSATVADGLFFWFFFLIFLGMMFCASRFVWGDDTVCDIGSSRQLFIDDWLVASLDNAEFQIHRPERKEIAVEFGSVPWEGNSQGYFSLINDGRWRHLYYDAWGRFDKSIPLTLCYMRSRDGIHWERPNLGIVEFEGSTQNNIIMDKVQGCVFDSFNPFIDTKPGTPPESKYKAIGYLGNAEKGYGLFAFQSPDAVHWTPMKNDFVFKGKPFDSQNCVFWSDRENRYVLYYRDKENLENGAFVRVINKAVSDNLIDWTDLGRIQFSEDEKPTLDVQFYTNQIFPYYRNRDLLIGFPARYTDRGDVPGTWALPEPEARRDRMNREEPRSGTAVTDSIFISSRDGVHFDVSDDVFVAPGLRTAHNWVYGDNYLAWGITETASLDDDSPNELSFYSTESDATGTDSRLRRYALRIDGFRSIHTPSKVGYAVTKPLTFTGRELSLNVATSAMGNLRVEIRDAAGAPIPGYSMEECDVVFGDFLDRHVTWNGSADLSALAGKTISLRFKMNETDLYSLQFVE